MIDSRPLPRIVLVNQLYAPFTAGGAEVVVASLARHLALRGWDVHVVTSCAPGDDDLVGSVHDGVTIHRFFPTNLYWMFDKRPRGRLRKILWRLINLWNPFAARKLRKLLIQIKPDIVHTHNIASFSPLIWPIARELGLPIIHTAHDYYLLCPQWLLPCKAGGSTGCRKCGLYRRYHARKAAESDVFCSPSQFLLDQHRPWLGDRIKLAYHRNGITPEASRGIDIGASEDGVTRFLLLGQLVPHKGIQVVCDAMPLLSKEAAIEVHIAGDGPLRTMVEALAASDPRVTYHGFISGDAKHALTRRAHVLLLPSLWYENCPMSLMEATDAGLTVIASDLGSLPELVTDGIDGCLIPAGDPQAWANKMHHLAANPGTLTMLRQNAQARAAKYDETSVIDGYVEEYNALIAQYR